MASPPVAVRLADWTKRGMDSSVAKTTQTIGTQQLPILDRSRSRLRLPIEILPEALRQASGEGLASPLATVRLESGDIIVDGVLDPVAAEMLRVIAEASDAEAANALVKQVRDVLGL